MCLIYQKKWNIIKAHIDTVKHDADIDWGLSIEQMKGWLVGKGGPSIYAKIRCHLFL